ncbi:MAG: hypothetical protein ACLP59_25920 [Bryobacteraceae bacterium]
MGHTLTLDISGDLYEALRTRAEQRGLGVEQVATDCLAESLSAGIEDPLLGLAGVVASEISDVAEKHDLYIGRALAEKLTHRSG